MKQLKTFFITALIGGLVVLLPIGILVQIFMWLFTTLSETFAPVTTVIEETTGTRAWVAGALTVAVLVSVCFAIGLLVRTAWGQWLHDRFESLFLMPIPGYSLLKDLFGKLQPKPEKSMNAPVLFKFNSKGDYLLGYITDEYDDKVAVFVPTSPSPVNGFVFQTHRSNVVPVETSMEGMMNVVLGCGVGSSKLVAKAKFDSSHEV